VQRPVLPAAAAEQRIAEVAHRLRAEGQRSVERIETVEAPRATPVAPPAPAAPPASIAMVAKAAVAAAILQQPPSEDVTIRPIAPKPSLFIDPPAPAPERQEPETFIPPQAERPAARALRMPRIDELPVPAQNEIRARRGELPQPPQPERVGLLQRLTSGLGRRSPEDEAPPNQRGAAPSPPERLSGRPLPRGADSRHEPVSEYAKRPSPQGLDQHGRQTTVHNAAEEDQLDIPAFLRRQAT
jgi:cell division protein FtsZ